MTEHEKQTVEYILSMEWEDLDVWLDTKTDSEVNRLLYLLRTALSELIVRDMEEEEFIAPDTFPDAAALLKRFVKNG